MNGLSYTNKYLKGRSPEEWAALIQELTPKLRVEVSKIVWWDFFGNRLVGDRWPQLDEYLNVPVDATIQRGDLIKALVAIGYTECQATGRVK